MFLGELAISPDGTRLAFTASKAGGQPALWIRDLDGPSAQPVAGAENAFFPFWSPDGRFIGFFADGKLKRVDPSGGTILTICDADRGVGARGTATGRSSSRRFPRLSSTAWRRAAANPSP